MKKIFTRALTLVLTLTLFSTLSTAQTQAWGTGISYGTGNPTYTPVPKQSRFWYDLNNGNFWKFDGTIWVLVASVSGADNWGTQVAITNLTMEGDGTAGNPLGVDTTVIATQTDLIPFLDSVRIGISQDSIIILYEDGVEVDRDTIRGISPQGPFYIKDYSGAELAINKNDTLRVKNGLDSDASNGYEVGLGGELLKNTSILAQQNTFTFNQDNQVYLQTNTFANTLFPFMPKDSFSWRMWSIDSESNRSIAGVSEGIGAVGSVNGPTGQMNVFLGGPDGAYIWSDDGLRILSPGNDTSSFIIIDTAMMAEVSSTSWLIGIGPDSTLYRVPWENIGSGGSNGIISSDLTLADVDSIRRGLSGGTYVYDKGLGAEMKIGYDYVVDSIINTIGAPFEEGKYIYIVENQGRYLVQSDTFPGVQVDTLTAIPVANGKYALLSPADGYLTPQMFRGYPNDLIPDDPALNAIFRFLENIDLPDNDTGQQIPVETPMNVRITGGNFIVADTVFLPKDYNVASDKDYPLLRIDGYGGTLYCQTDSIVMLFHAGKNGSDFTTLSRGDYSAYIEGLTFKGGGPDSTRKSITGIFIGAMDYFVIQNLKMNNLGTNIFVANTYGGKISNVEIQGNLHRGIYVRSGTLWDNITNPCTAGNTELLVEKVRVVNTYSATLGKVYSQFEFVQCSGLTVKNCIAEGVRPFYNMIISYNGNSCTNPANISTFYIENATHPSYVSDTDTCTNIWLKSLAYETYLDNVYFNFSKPDTLIRSDAQADGFLKLTQVNLPYTSSFATPGFVLTDGTKWRTVVMETERVQTIADLRTFCTNAFSNFDHTSIITIKTPGGIFSSTGYQLNMIGYANNLMGSSSALTIGGNLTFSNLTNKNYLGIRGGASGLSYKYRPTGIGVGNEGLFLNWSAKIGWDQTEIVDLNTGPYPTPGFYFALDTTGRIANAITQNLIINPRNNNGEFRLYKNGYLKLEGYGSSFDMTAGTLGKTIQHYAGWDTDGGLLHIPTIPSTDITSLGDSATIAEEITGIDSRLDSLESLSIRQFAEFGLTAASDNMTASTSYGDITHSTNWIDGDTTNLLTHTDGVVTYTGSLDKKFEVDCSGTVTISEETQTVTVAPVQDGVVQALNEVTVKNGGGNWPTPVPISSIISLSNGDTFKLQWKASGTTGTVTFNSMTCVLTQLN